MLASAKYSLHSEQSGVGVLVLVPVAARVGVLVLVPVKVRVGV
jgi:hypothetical protein